MAVTDDPKTLGRARLSFAKESDIDEFVSTLEKFENGELGPDGWRAFRLVRGTYGQRQPGDVQMMRVKIPQGILNEPQLYALADVGERYSRGFGHITTRQNIQFHFVKLHDVEPAMRRLADAGLTTREACGNSVRNITSCPYAGVAADEVFDVSPYADAMTRYLLRHPLSSSLPRKFKIAFEGCPEDHVFAAINDLGFRARVKDYRGTTKRGFRVLVGGGTAILCKSGAVLFDFLPASEILDVAEAIIRVFHRFGDFKHKQHNRMKFLIKSMGWDRWSGEVHQALADVRAEGGTRLPFDPDQPPVEWPPDWRAAVAPSVAGIAARVSESLVKGPGFIPDVQPTFPVMDGDYFHWHETNVRAQKQTGFATVTATVPLGDFTGQQMRVLADLAAAYGDGLVRISNEQDVVFRWIRHAEVPELYRRLSAAGLGLADANTVADITSCPGAESCKLAVTQSRGLARTLEDHLRTRPDLVKAASSAKIKISGCPNGCGQHHIGTIGFQGSVRKLGSRVVPQYFVMLGGGVTDQGASFGRLSAKIPARRISDAVERLLGLYAAERQDGETPADFFRQLDVRRAKALLADLEFLEPESTAPAHFFDIGEDDEYKPEVQDGECSA